MKKKYCSKCGEEMKLIPMDGEWYFADGDREDFYYRQIFNTNNGKPLRLYSCPNWRLRRVGWLYKRNEDNGHDRFSEKKE